MNKYRAWIVIGAALVAFGFSSYSDTAEEIALAFVFTCGVATFPILYWIVGILGICPDKPKGSKS